MGQPLKNGYGLKSICYDLIEPSSEKYTCLDVSKFPEASHILLTLALTIL